MPHQIVKWITAHLSALLLCFGVLGLSSCASTPDPAEVCSAEWIAPRAQDAVTRIDKRARGALKALSKASESWVQGRSPGMLDLWSLSRSLTKLNKEATDGQGINDLRMLARTCNDPELIQNAMHGLLIDYDLDSQFITEIENNPIYQYLLSGVWEPESTKQAI